MSFCSPSLSITISAPGVDPCRSNIWAMVTICHHGHQSMVCSGVACSHPKEDGTVMKSRKRPKPPHIYIYVIYVLNIIYISPSGHTFLSVFLGWLYVYYYSILIYFSMYIYIYIYVYIYMLYIDIAMMFGIPMWPCVFSGRVKNT